MNVPIRFRVRGEDESKLVIASEMISDAMKILKDRAMVILLCDSWYPKGEVIKTVKAYDNLELIANIRVDTAMFELPERTGKPGRPEKKGKPVSIRGDFICRYTLSAGILKSCFTNSKLSGPLASIRVANVNAVHIQLTPTSLFFSKLIIFLPSLLTPLIFPTSLLTLFK